LKAKTDRPLGQGQKKILFYNALSTRINIVEQDYRRVKRITRSMLGFKSFQSAQSTLAGIELVATLRKGQIKKNLVGVLSPAEQFHALAA